ncbi:YihY/virulence factor BrkB family protein [Sandaracinus amylolyticus]|uniref:YihY/virulence factor BrkB family protein n=1 Tax=Sandaracinus amylolyticus TaxID=927083 RepID=UPI00069F063A|nr:YihY/virulence factor BrkB family protein [Sandaracinus amylolyticus]
MANTTHGSHDLGAAHERDRGREAERPTQIPPKGWKDVLLRVKKEMKEDRISVVAASVAFWTILAIFPALIALVLLYGLISDPAEVERQVSSMSSALPGDARTLLSDQMRGIVSTPRQGLGIGLVVSLLGALWAASGGMRALIDALNIAYDQQETRNFFKLRALSIALTVGAILFIALAVFSVGVLPVIFEYVGLGRVVERVLEFGRWPLLALLATIGLSALYRFAPCRTHAKWRWVTPGGVVATAFWLGATALFSFYVSNFGSYNETYGALGGVIVLLLWLYLSSYAVLLGAEINAEMEHQTAKDSTVGEPAPMGERGATMADTLGPSYAR